MPTERSDATVDPTPLLTNAVTDQIFRSHRFIRRPPSLRGAARFLRRASSRRMMREPSMRVRESAAQQIEERRSDWAYSRPIVILDLVWNLAFVLGSIAMLIMSRKEKPASPLRLWIVGYCCQCVLHMVCVAVEYKRRYYQSRFDADERLEAAEGSGGGGGWWSSRNSTLSSGSDVGEDGDYVSQRSQNDDETSFAKHLESANTMFSFIWWIIGFYWVSTGGQKLTHDSPQLYWFVHTSLSNVVISCRPDIKEGATKDDIDRLPKYKFRRIGDFEKQNGEIQESFSGIMTECNTDMPTETVLPPEDAECCICLCAYEDGTELRELPCRHHFHCTCIDKWLYINATCPLCKFNILKNGNQSGSEEV